MNTDTKALTSAAPTRVAVAEMRCWPLAMPAGSKVHSNGLVVTVVLAKSYENRGDPVDHNRWENITTLKTTEQSFDRNDATKTVLARLR